MSAKSRTKSRAKRSYKRSYKRDWRGRFASAGAAGRRGTKRAVRHVKRHKKAYVIGGAGAMVLLGQTKVGRDIPVVGKRYRHRKQVKRRTPKYAAGFNSPKPGTKSKMLTGGKIVKGNRHWDAFSPRPGWHYDTKRLRWMR